MKRRARAESDPPYDEMGRFSDNVAVAVVTRRDRASRFRDNADTGDPAEVIADALGTDVLDDPALGSGRLANGSLGRGAANWVPVLQWTLEMAAGGLIGNAAWAGLKLAAARFREIVSGAETDDVRLIVSRGAAALLAIGHVLDSGFETDIVDVEAVVEPTVLAGRPVTESSYVDFEPWLVTLVNETRTARYFVAVAPSGEILGTMRVPMTEFEHMYLTLPPRAGDG